MNLLKPSFVTVCSLGVLVRVVFLAYGEWQDANMQVKYTDVDYKVFTDAARLVTQGRSPYARATYRYTPLLAFLLTPNIYIHPVFGKLLFVLADLLVGYLICQLLLLRGLGKEKAVLLTGATWLLNPMVAAISTRGNAESLLGAMILLTIYWILTKRFVSASLLYGISVHFKLYPIIYAIPLVILLDDEDYSGHRRKGKEKAYPRWSRQYWNRQITMFVTPTRIRFALLSGGIFFILNAFMYYLYSQEFLKETYLYHVTRRDHRHNFSLWFYYIYLNYHSQTRLPWLGWQGFLQLGSVTLLGSVFGKDIFFALFVQTFAFVTYNRVCTSQRVFNDSRMGRKSGFVAIPSLSIGVSWGEHIFRDMVGECLVFLS
ncbi:hypothetical protein G9A89_015406 [Geosiphon pyriformis]|nr:hypothetical protein G9A89_015406 [Geosiphon pyriformis]